MGWPKFAGVVEVRDMCPVPLALGNVEYDTATDSEPLAPGFSTGLGGAELVWETSASWLMEPAGDSCSLEPAEDSCPAGGGSREPLEDDGSEEVLGFKALEP